MRGAGGCGGVTRRAREWSLEWADKRCPARNRISIRMKWAGRKRRHGSVLSSSGVMRGFRPNARVTRAQTRRPSAAESSFAGGPAC